ncbi:MAG: general secretion pathway protein GspK [Planctomycetes bacterium]|nr:general secretion pathway protein GspK [Planctomycetota bacterium]
MRVRVQPMSETRRADLPDRADERGIALVLALIFSILLYILVAELVVAGRMVRATGENDALLARMRSQMLYQLAEAEDQLLTDLAGSAGGEEGAGGMADALGGALGGAGGRATGGADRAGGATGGSGASGGAGGEAEEEETDPTADCDSSRDAWFQPVGNADDDLTTYVWVEDENRKFNLLALWSPDEKFADLSRDRLVRLIDSLREDTEFDVSASDAERIVQELRDWVARPDLEAIPRPRLKSDEEKRPDVTAILHLDELMMLPSVSEDLFFDKVLDGKVYLGLESVLTIWTSLKVDPGDPEKVARQRAQAAARGEAPAEGSDPAAAAGGASSAAGAAAGTAPESGRSPGGEDEPVQPDGLGIRINLNTAPRPVLRALFPSDKIPDRVIDAILRYRNEEDEEEAEKAAEQQGATDLADFGDLRLGADKKLKFFASVADLEQIEEFANLPDPELKTEFQRALTTKSEVFTIHLATLFKRNDENRVYLLRRARSVVLRLEDGEAGKIVPLLPFEERTGLRLMPVDLQDQTVDLTMLYLDMDQFAREERAWNPFLIDFYLPKHQREDFYQPR